MKPHAPSDLSSFHMTPADPDRHLMPISQMTADAFANGQYVDEISRQYIGNCHYDWDTSRLIWDEERLIHHWGVWGYPMRVGRVTLKVAGIGAVVTEEAYRKRGLMERAALDSIVTMGENGYDLSILRGRHYVKFGYARAWNYVTYRLTPEEIPSLEALRPYELLGPEEMDAIIALYNRDHEAFSGTCVRPTYRMLTAEDNGFYGWLDGEGQLEGYVRAKPTEDKKTLQCLEAAGDPETGLAALADLFKKGEYEALTFFTMPHHHPMQKIIRRGACIQENRYFYHTGWRVRIVNLQSALTKLLPLLEERLHHSHLAAWQGELHLNAGEQSANLKFENGKALVTEGVPSQHNLQGGAEIGRFLIGSDEPEEIIQQSEMVCTGKGIELAAALFPNLYPMMSHWDEF